MKATDLKVMKEIALKVALYSLLERLQGNTLLYISLSKLFQILVPLYANERWPVAVL